MDNPVRYKLIEEICRQCQFASMAMRQLRSHLVAGDSERVFFHVHAFLNHALVLAQFLWPERESSSARGADLRDQLGVDSGSVLALSAWRRPLEHPDEQYEDWLLNLPEPNFVPANLMPGGTLAEFKPDSFLRDLDPESFQFQWAGCRCDLRELAAAIQKLEQQGQKWLKSNQPW